MKWVLFVLAVIMAGMALVTLRNAESAVHEILAITILIVGAILFTGGAVVEAVQQTRP